MKSKNKKLAVDVFELVKSEIPSKDAATVNDFIYEHNEWGLGVEMLIDCILEEEITISQEQMATIVLAAEAMSINRGQEKILVKKSI